jgi:hypothetical protein
MNKDITDIAKAIDSLISVKVRNIVNNQPFEQMVDRWNYIKNQLNGIKDTLDVEDKINKDNSYTITFIKDEGYRIAINDVLELIKRAENYYSIEEDEDAKI